MYNFEPFFLPINNQIEPSWNFCVGFPSTLRCSLTFGLMGLSVGMSVPSALCLLESKTLLLLVIDFWQILACFSFRKRKKMHNKKNLIRFYTCHHLRCVPFYYLLPYCFNHISQLFLKRRDEHDLCACSCKVKNVSQEHLFKKI